MGDELKEAAELDVVVKEILALDPDGLRCASVLRETIDQLYDGQRTGRYRWDQLFKTEKTHCGTLVEINLQREFRFEDGKHLDYSLLGIEVDCKYSQRLGGWMIPPEAREGLCMVVWAEDTNEPKWSLGIVRAKEKYLNRGNNRDAKATLNSEGRKSIRWLWDKSPLHPNVLLQLEPDTVANLMALNSGQKRINELFRVAQKMIVGRAVVATVAQQKDPMKRVRANGGARSRLRGEGLLVLGQYKSHQEIAADLGIPVPGTGDTISVRVTRAKSNGPGVSMIDGGFWRVADDNDPIDEAPLLPKPTRLESRQAGED